MITSATGGKKGWSQFTETGRSTLNLFLTLQEQHQQFLIQLNQELTNDLEIRLLLQRSAFKTSVHNQLFGTVGNINFGAVNASVEIKLSQKLHIEVSLSLSTLQKFELVTGVDAALLINSSDIIISATPQNTCFSTPNRLSAEIIYIQQDKINAEITLVTKWRHSVCLITLESATALALSIDTSVWVLFKPNAPILGVKK